MKSKFDCSQFVPKKCQAFCCGPVPIPTETYFKHEDKIQREVVYAEMLSGAIMPHSKDKYCVFLSKELKCSIYEDRPSVCKSFGVTESSSLIQCPFMKPSGRHRSKEEQKQLSDAFYKELSDSRLL